MWTETLSQLEKKEKEEVSVHFKVRAQVNAKTFLYSVQFGH